MLDHALQYAGRGWRVFPVHVSVGGACSCGRNCGTPGKHPRIKAWQKHATADPNQVAAWWTRWPDANIGLATGGGLVVIDVDGEAEAAGLKAIAAQRGKLAATAVVRTGRGFHLYFKGEYNTTKKVQGLLVRGSGGYVILPPSLHPSGVRYQWLNGNPLSNLPAWFEDWCNEFGEGDNKKGLISELGKTPAHLSGRAQVLTNNIKTPWDGWQEAEIRSALAAIPADCERDTWLRVGMALHSLGWEGNEGDIGFDLWLEWSETARHKFVGIHDLETRWKSFRRAGVTIGSLFHEARIRGWGQPKGGDAHISRIPEGKSEYAARPPEPLLARLTSGDPGAGAPVGANQEQGGSGGETPVSPPDQTVNNGVIGGNGIVNGHQLPPAMTAVPPVNPADVPLIRLNEGCAVVGHVGGKTLVLNWIPSTVDPGTAVPSLESFKSFAELHSHEYVFQQGKWKPLGAEWLKWPQRRTFAGLDLRPAAPAILPGDVVNLWRGWGVESKPGEWRAMKRHLAEVVASGDRASLEYIVRWAAWAVQNPGEPAGVALVLRGDEGTGKGMFCRALRAMFGPHGLQVYNRRHLIGNFNAHMRSCLLLYADEAFWAGDKQGESVLKGLITEPTIPIEQKGHDVVNWPNRLHVMMTANAKWVVPASHSARRYAVFDISEKYMQNKSWFDPISHEMKNGGLAAMLYDLNRMELDGWHPREILQTEALREQKLRSLDPLHAWLEGILQEGELPGVAGDSSRMEWLWNCVRQHHSGLRDFSQIALSRFLKEWGGIKIHKNDGNHWRLPPLGEMRAGWEKRYGKWKWEETTEWRARG